jgi:hypothetical protein
MIRVESRGHDQELGREGGKLRRNVVERLGLHELGPDHLEHESIAIVDLLCDDEHLGAEFGQRVGDGEARHSEPEDTDAESGPVVVPAREAEHPVVDGLGHREIHSR